MPDCLGSVKSYKACDIDAQLFLRWGQEKERCAGIKQS